MNSKFKIAYVCKLSIIIRFKTVCLSYEDEVMQWKQETVLSYSLAFK